MYERAGDGRTETQELLQRLEEVFETVSFAVIEAVDDRLREVVISE